MSSGPGVKPATDTVIASTSTNPTTAAPIMAPTPPSHSPTNRPTTITAPRNRAKPTTVQKANGLLNLNVCASCTTEPRQYVEIRAMITAAAAAASSGGATNSSRLTLSTRTIAKARRNMTALAIATPAARMRGEPSFDAARCALAMVTAVDDASPPAAPASRTPWLAPKYLTAT